MTTEEWKRRQQEAAEQVRQMQQKARSFDHDRDAGSCLPLTPPPLTRRPPEREALSHRDEHREEPCAPASTGGLSTLLADPDRALLLLLMVLLLKNNASLELIVALCYLAF